MIDRGFPRTIFATSSDDHNNTLKLEEPALSCSLKMLYLHAIFVFPHLQL